MIAAYGHMDKFQIVILSNIHNENEKYSLNSL